MLDAIDDVDDVSVLEKDLKKTLDSGRRPRFVMQNKGDMMSSVAFMYNYIVFFAVPATKWVASPDPFYADVVTKSQGAVPDPFFAFEAGQSTSDFKIGSPKNDPGVAIEQLQAIISLINQSISVQYSPDSNKLTMTIGDMKSVSDGWLSLLPAPVHYGQKIKFTESSPQYSAFFKYASLIEKTK
jgi:hypothetical protein